MKMSEITRTFLYSVKHILKDNSVHVLNHYIFLISTFNFLTCFIGLKIWAGVHKKKDEHNFSEFSSQVSSFPSLTLAHLFFTLN